VDISRQRKIERYMKNARKFLWGLPRRNQKETYAWLRGKGYNVRGGSYSHVTAQLLEENGIEQVAARVIIPTVKELFTEAALSYLKMCWRSGTTPDLSVLRTYNLHSPLNAEPFVEINSQFNYVVGWGELAGVWFEEIEPDQDSGMNL